MYVVLGQNCSEGLDDENMCEYVEVMNWLQKRNLSQLCVCCIKFSSQSYCILHLKPEVSLKLALESFECPRLLETELSPLCEDSSTNWFRVIFYAHVLSNFLHLIKFDNYRITTFIGSNLQVFTESSISAESHHGHVSNFVICNDRILAKCEKAIDKSHEGRSNKSSKYIVVGHLDKELPFSDLLADVTESLEECYHCKYESLERENLNILTRSVIRLEMMKASHHKALNLSWTSSASKTEACFIMYNASRLHCILTEFDRKVAINYYAPLPKVEDLDLSDILFAEEWSLIQRLVLELNPTINRIWESLEIENGSNQVKFSIHLLFVYLSKLVRGFSVYYSKHKVLMMPQNDLVLRTVHLRVHVMKLVYSVLERGLHIAGCQILDRM